MHLIQPSLIPSITFYKGNRRMNREDLNNINVRIGGLYVRANQIGHGFIVLSIIFGATVFPYSLEFIREEPNKYTFLFNMIATFYDLLIGIPLRSTTEFLLSIMPSELAFFLIIPFWIIFYALIFKVYSISAKKIGHLKITTIIFGPLVIALLLMILGADKRPVEEVQVEIALAKEKALTKQIHLDEMSSKRTKKNKEESIIWEKTVEQLGMLGFQIIFPSEGLDSFLGDWTERGQLATKIYANKKGLDNYTQGSLFEIIDHEYKDFLIPIQQCLINNKYITGVADGQLGASTINAIKLSISKFYGLDNSENINRSEKKAIVKQANADLSYSAVNLGNPNRAYEAMLKKLHPSCSLN